MEPYFLWNNVRSTDLGVVVTSYPPIIRPPERVIQQVIPGRAGSVTLAEGKHVYEAYIKQFVIGLRRNFDAENVIRWLRGEGEAIFGNEPEFRYFGRIISAVQFDKIGSWALKSAGVQLYTQPYKTTAAPGGTVNFTSAPGALSLRLNNPGSVQAAPKITLGWAGDITLTAGNTAMAIQNAPGILIIDCDAGVIFDRNGTAWTGKWTGDFLSFDPGAVEIAVDKAGAALTIDPRWRWV